MRTFTKVTVGAAVCYSLTSFSLSVTFGEPAETQPVRVEIAAQTTPSSVVPAAEIDAAPATSTSVAESSIKALSVESSRRCPEFEPLFAEAGLPVAQFSFIAWRESRCTPTAYNSTLNRDKSRDYGLLQINSTWKTVTMNICGQPFGHLDVLFTVDCNIAVAKYLYNNGGLGHWSL